MSPLPVTSSRARRWRRAHPALSVFIAGLLVRIVGLLLIWAANGHSSVTSKAIVVLGVVLSVFGIGVLKWLSFQPRRKPATSAAPPRSSPPAA
jgi:protein-S-isoprenylcysteine O-methyltransferase Ste14